jgi:hypothetical protein
VFPPQKALQEFPADKKEAGKSRSWQAFRRDCSREECRLDSEKGEQRGKVGTGNGHSCDGGHIAASNCKMMQLLKNCIETENDA